MSEVLFTGPTGTPSASKRRIQCAEGCFLSASPRIGTSAPRFLMRSVFVVKRASAASSGMPIAFKMRSQFDWFAPPRLIHPSAVGNAWYGAVRMCAEPEGPGSTPVAK